MKVVVKNEKIQRLDSIVCEVKESEEWEEVRMSIYSVALEQGFARGKELGKKVGEEIGKEANRISLICKKLRRGKSVEEIADEMEENLESIKTVCIIASKYAPDYDIEEILKEVLHE